MKRTLLEVICGAAAVGLLASLHLQVSRLERQQRDVAELEHKVDRVAEATASMATRDPRAELAALRDVCGGTDFGLMSCNEMPVTSRNQIGLNEISTHLDGESIRLEGMLGAVAGGTAVRDNERCRMILQVVFAHAVSSLRNTTKRRSGRFGSPKRSSP